jgi:hypothetical protein
MALIGGRKVGKMGKTKIVDKRGKGRKLQAKYQI